MKKLFFAFCFLLLVGLSSASAQKHIIKTNPLGLAFGNFNATYEHVLNNGTSSVLVSANYLYKLFGVDVNNFGAQAAYRYYITNKKIDVPTGFYVNPQIGFSTGGADDNFGFNQDFTTFSIGAELGYQWAWDSGMVLDLGIGPNYTSISNEEINGDLVSGILPSATIALGYAW